MLYCIIGPSGCGKSTVVSELNKLGYKSPDSYTTRPRRYPEEGGHTFITQYEFNNLENKVAYTKYNGYEYCVTAEMLDNCDFYIVDPFGVKTLVENNYKNFKVIGLAVNPEECVTRMINRGDSEDNIVARLDTDSFAFKNFSVICDYIIDATLPVTDVVNAILDIVKTNQ